MATPLSTPEAVYGHWVRNERLACTGCAGRFVAYAVGPSSLVVLPADGAQSAATSQRVYHLEQPALEVLSCLSMHPHEDVLCVGTVGHGMYVTKASSPVFSSHTRLPFSMTGEHIFSACFAPLASAATVLVFSSTFLEKKGPQPHRLSLWHLDDRQLLWRGAMEPLTCLCPLAAEGSFAACAGSRLYLFTAQTAAADEATSVRQRVVVLSRLCTSVPQLDGVEYVQCLSVPVTGEESGFYALTTNGFLVAFDVTTGAVSRWMDCKVCPATSMRLWRGVLILTGSLVRFFRADDWKFGGKARPIAASADLTASPAVPALEEVLGDALLSTCVPLERHGEHVLFFSRGGSLAVCECDVTASSGDDIRATTVSVGKFTPATLQTTKCTTTLMPPLRAQWLLPQPADAHEKAVLWTRGGLMSLTPRTHTSLSLPEAMSCAVYHDASDCVLVFMTAQEQWMTFDCPSAPGIESAASSDAAGGASAWSPCGVLSWSSSQDGEPLHAVVSPVTGDVAVLSSGNTITRLTCVRESAATRVGSSPSAAASPTSTVLVRRRHALHPSCRAPLWKLLYAADRLYGVASQSLVLVESGDGRTGFTPNVASEEFPVAEGIVDACGTARDIAVAHAKGAYLYRTDRTGRRAVVPVPDAVSLGILPLRLCQYDPTTACLALANDAQVLLYRQGAQSLSLIHVVSVQPVPERPAVSLPLPFIRAVGVRAARDSAARARVLLLNSVGQVTEYTAEVGELSPPASAPVPSAFARDGPTAQSVGWPSATAASLLPPRDAASCAAGRPPLGTAPPADSTTASRRTRRSTSAAAPTSDELRNRFDELNGFYTHQKEREALTPRGGRRASARQGGAKSPGTTAAAAAATRSASAPLRGLRTPRTTRAPLDSGGAAPSSSGSPVRPKPVAVTPVAAAPGVASLSAVEVSALSELSALGSPIADKRGRGAADDSARIDGDMSAPNIPIDERDAEVYGGWGPGRARAREAMTPSRVAPVPGAVREHDESIASDASSVATTFSIRARTLRQSLVDLQQLLNEGGIPDEVNSSESLNELTHLLTSVAASLQTLHQPQ